METEEEAVQQRQQAIEDFNQHEHRGDGARVAGSLAGGLTLLRDLLYTRLHEDVERRIGEDSMLLPVSPEKTARTTKVEIDLYQVAVSAIAAGEQGYLTSGDDWYLTWLTRFCLGRLCEDARVVKRLSAYLAATPDKRRLMFTNVMASALAESRRAPLVLFRLFPHAVRIVTALAFDDHALCDAARERQLHLLPSIRDCHHCRGKLLDNGEECRLCGNPLWKFEWLTAAD
jgi:hypothetical protein